MKSIRLTNKFVQLWSFVFLFCLLSGKMGLDQAEQLITKFSFNIPVQYKFVSTSEAYKIAK